jgi:PST family polysaccharide transporter
VQTALPFLVLHMLGAESVGYMRPALGLTVYLFAFLTSAMANDYFPRLSAASDQAALLEIANVQHRLVLLLAGPALLALIGLAPWLVPLFYSSSFLPALPLLEWQAVASLLRFSSWTLSFVILARRRSDLYLFGETCAGIMTLGSAAVGMRVGGLEGLGIAAMLTYVVYLAIVAALCRAELGRVLTPGNLMLVAGLFASGLLQIAGERAGIPGRTPLALVLAVAWAGYGAATILPVVRPRSGGPR